MDNFIKGFSAFILSIVVAIYDLDSYLNKCLDALVNQTLQEIEILCVDDGSTDESRNICEEYKLKYPQTIVVHKENGGLSSARNYGVENSCGEYIMFLDSDDYIDTELLSNLDQYINEKIGNLDTVGVL